MHVQTRYCHPSLGMKIHFNIQDIVYMEGEQDLSFGDGRLWEWSRKLLSDDGGDLVAFMFGACCGGGLARPASPCHPDKSSRWSVHGAGSDLKSYKGLLYTAFVSGCFVIFLLLTNLHVEPN